MPNTARHGPHFPENQLGASLKGQDGERSDPVITGLPREPTRGLIEGPPSGSSFMVLRSYFPENQLGASLKASIRDSGRA